MTNESFAEKILKLIEIKSIENKAKIVDVKINEKILDYLKKNFNEDLSYFQKKNNIKINLDKSEDLNLLEYTIEFSSKSKKVLEKIEKFENLKKIIINKKEKKIKTKKHKKILFKKRIYKKRIYKKKN